MIAHLGKPQIRELEIVVGGFIRSMVYQDKNTMTEYISIKEYDSSIFEKRIYIFQELAEKENFKLGGIYTHNNKKHYLFSKRIK